MKKVLFCLAILVTAFCFSPTASAAQTVTCPAGVSNCAQISWSAPTSGGTPTGYNVYHSTTNGGCATVNPLPTSCTKVGSTTVPTVSFLDSPLTPNTTYYFNVTAFNATGEGLPSTQVSGTTGAAIPGQPQTIIIQVK